MTTSIEEQSSNEAASRPILRWLLLLFFGSGCAALIYEIVWLQLLEFVIGSSGISLGVLLGTYMGGLCLGSLLLARLVSPMRHPLRVYAFLEIGLGLIAIAVLFGIPYLAGVYAHCSWHGVISRALVSAVCLLPPTLLMGATLPAVARWVESTPEGVSWMGFFYVGNTIGAVAGCLLAGFFLLRIYSMPAATFVAASIDFAIAAIALMLAGKSPRRDAPSSAIQLSGEPAWRPGPIYLTIAMSGLCALGAEVVWTRLLSLLMGGTVYAFSIILAMFLVGLGIGSGVGSVMARTSSNPRVALGFCQLLLTAAIAWAAFMICRSLPYWPINPSIYTDEWGPWYTFQIDLLRAAWTVLPATMLWGASFPLALAAVASRGQDPGRMMGGIYAANTVGAIAGSLGFSLLLIPEFGTQFAERALIILSGVSAAVSLASSFVWTKNQNGSKEHPHNPMFSFSGMAWTLIALVIVGFMVKTVSGIPWVVAAWGRFSANYISQSLPGVIGENKESTEGGGLSQWRCTYLGEGMNVTVAVTKNSSGQRFFHGAGKVQASTLPQDMRLQRMLGHLSALASKNPENVNDVLVVACGAGITAGSFVLYPNVKHIVVCDIERLVPKVVAPMFGNENYHIVDGIGKSNPHFVNGKEVTVVYDDGRHYISTLPKTARFDVITSDPIDPWVKGSAALNTIEYYEMCKSHLKPGGVMSLWMPLYESNIESAKSMIATFFRVFPNGILFSNDRFYEGYDGVLLGQAEPIEIDVDRLQKTLDRRDYSQVRESLMDAGFGQSGSEPSQADCWIAINLLATFAGHASSLEKWMKNAQINRDRNLRLQYLAGMSFNSYIGTQILQSILQYYKFPEHVFVGSRESIWMLKQALADEGRREK